MALTDDLADLLSRRREAYQATFAGPPGQRVLADLARFCRANESTFHADPRVHALAEGRREVFLRIVKHLNLSTEDLMAFYTQGAPQ
jgi:hypothetical protein